jgi:methionine synthase II (cobalamin-independent)
VQYSKAIHQTVGVTGTHVLDDSQQLGWHTNDMLQVMPQRLQVHMVICRFNVNESRSIATCYYHTSTVGAVQDGAKQ